MKKEILTIILAIITLAIIVAVMEFQTPISGRFMVKGVAWNSTTDSWENMGLWCRRINDYLYCEQYHDVWIDEYCTYKETCEV